MIMIDGAHSPADSANLYNYLKTVKLPKYGIWAMTKNKEPDLFIKQFKNIFEKIVTMPIDDENSTEPAIKLNKIALKNKLNSEVSNSLIEALKKISSKKKKTNSLFWQSIQLWKYFE